MIPTVKTFTMTAKTTLRVDVSLQKPGLLVLVHGFINNPYHMSDIYSLLHSYYEKTIVIDLYDGHYYSGTHTVDTPIGSDGTIHKDDLTLAHKLYSTISSELRGKNYQYIDILAHSMGGLVARSMITDFTTNGYLAGVKIRHFITLGTPHEGTYLANWARPFFEIGVRSYLYFSTLFSADHDYQELYDTYKDIVNPMDSMVYQLVQMMEGSYFIGYLMDHQYKLNNIQVSTIAGTPSLTELSHPPRYLIFYLLVASNPDKDFLLNFFQQLYDNEVISWSIFDAIAGLIVKFFTGKISFGNMMGQIIDALLEVGSSVVDSFLLALKSTINSAFINDGLVSKTSALTNFGTNYTVGLHHGHLLHESPSLNLLMQILNP